MATETRPVIDVLHGSLDGAATAVSQNQNEGHVQFGDRLFNATLHGDASAFNTLPASMPFPRAETNSGRFVTTG